MPSAPAPSGRLSAPEIKRLIKAACDGWRAAGLDVGGAHFDPETGKITLLTPEAAAAANDPFEVWEAKRA